MTWNIVKLVANNGSTLYISFILHMNDTYLSHTYIVKKINIKKKQNKIRDGEDVIKNGRFRNRPNELTIYKAI